MSSFVAKKKDSRSEQFERVTHLKRILGEIKDIQREYKRLKKSNRRKKTDKR